MTISVLCHAIYLLIWSGLTSVYTILEISLYARSGRGGWGELSGKESWHNPPTEKVCGLGNN